MSLGERMGNSLNDNLRPRSAFAVARATKLHQNLDTHNAPTSYTSPDAEPETEQLRSTNSPIHVELANSTESESETAIDDQLQRTHEIISLSTWEPSLKNVRIVEDGVVLFMRNGDIITILGQYGLLVRNGTVHVYGATFGKSKVTHIVSAPTTHPLPSILCSSDSAEIHIKSCSRAVRKLRMLSPLFRRIWNHGGPVFESIDVGRSNDTFCFIPSSKADPLQRTMIPLTANSDQVTVMQKVCDPANGRVPTILICGAKITGKSTLSRLIMNRLITMQSFQTVFLLELDPLQPEFGPPGLVSLYQIRKPILGPPFAHSDTSISSIARLISAHTLTALSPNEDPEHFVQSANQLMHQYHLALERDPRNPLVIDCPSWLAGSGLEILVQFIQRWSPSDVVFLDGGPEDDVVPMLQEAAGNNFVHSFHAPRYRYTARPPAELSTMQAISYFHSDGVDQTGNMRWSATPLTDARPWAVRYDTEAPGIRGLMLHGENVAPDYLEAVFNGNVVSIVVLDDEDAFVTHRVTYENDPEAENNIDDAPPQANLNDRQITRVISQQESLQWPRIHRTPKENLPYILTDDCGYVTPLNPHKSHTIGQALVRGINIEEQILYLLTPVPKITINNIRKGCKTYWPNIILVRGRWDAPKWATEESLMYGSYRQAKRAKVSAVAPQHELGGKNSKGETDGGDIMMTTSDYEVMT